MFVLGTSAYFHLATEAGAPLLRKSDFLQHHRYQLHPRLQAWILIKSLAICLRCRA